MEGESFFFFWFSVVLESFGEFLMVFQTFFSGFLVVLGRFGEFLVV